jgi:hypothetical protein
MHVVNGILNGSKRIGRQDKMSGWVVHCMREDYDVYIGRGLCPKTGEPSIWANPFKSGTRKENIENFRMYLMENEFLLSQLHTLQGKVLG